MCTAWEETLIFKGINSQTSGTAGGRQVRQEGSPTAQRMMVSSQLPGLCQYNVEKKVVWMCSHARQCISTRHTGGLFSLPVCPGHRFEDNPGVRRHLMKKPSRSQITRTSKKLASTPSVKKKKKKKKLDRKPHEVSAVLLHLFRSYKSG